MSTEEIDEYLAGIDEPGRSTLQRVRESVLRAIPDADEGISYGYPAFRLHGEVVAGLGAFTHHLSYFPHSGSVLSRLHDDLVGYTRTKGSLHFPIDQPLPDELVGKLVSVRLSISVRAGRPPR